MKYLILSFLLVLAGCGESVYPEYPMINKNVVNFADKVCTSFGGVKNFRVPESYYRGQGLKIAVRCNDDKVIETFIPDDIYRQEQGPAQKSSVINKLSKPARMML